MLVRAKPWPKLLREVDGQRARTTREIGNHYGVIAAGTLGRVDATSRWEKLRFTADRCSGCGSALSVSGPLKYALELVDEGAA